MQQDSENTAADTGQAEPVQMPAERPDMATIKHVIGSPTVSWTCPECSSPVTVAGERLLPLLVMGQGAVVKCPAPECGQFVAVDGNKPQSSIVRPSVAMNREARRTIDSLARRGLIRAK